MTAWYPNYDDEGNKLHLEKSRLPLSDIGEFVSPIYQRTPLYGNRHQNIRRLEQHEKDISLPRDKAIETNFGEMKMPYQSINEDTFLDDEVGSIVRHIKENFGHSPLIEAYKAAIETFKEPDIRWKKYLEEEEAMFRSIFEGDIDRDI
jgi:hypothetical protein